MLFNAPCFRLCLHTSKPPAPVTLICAGGGHGCDVCACVCVCVSQERRKAEEERVLNALSQPLGFYKGRPVAAVLIFRSCLHWRSFQVDRTTLFDRIIGVIGSQIEKQQDDNNFLSYW